MRDPCALDASSYTETENILSGGVIEADLVAGKGIDKTGDKVLSTKSNDEIKKILESFRETQSGGDHENLKAKENQYV